MTNCKEQVLPEACKSCTAETCPHDCIHVNEFCKAVNTVVYKK